MLDNTAITAIGQYAKSVTNYELFGIGRPDFITAAKYLLFTYAFSKSQYLTPEQIKAIDKAILDIDI